MVFIYSGKGDDDDDEVEDGMVIEVDDGDSTESPSSEDSDVE